MPCGHVFSWWWQHDKCSTTGTRKQKVCWQCATTGHSVRSVPRRQIYSAANWPELVRATPHPEPHPEPHTKSDGRADTEPNCWTDAESDSVSDRLADIGPHSVPDNCPDAKSDAGTDTGATGADTGTDELADSEPHDGAHTESDCRPHTGTYCL